MKIKTILLFLSITGAAISCTTDPASQPGTAINKSIGVTVSGSNDVSTKSESADGELFDSFVIGRTGGRELKIDAYVSDTNPLAGQDGPETKGRIITAPYLADTLETFNMKAYAHDEWFDNTLADGTDGSKTDKKPAGLYFKKAVNHSTSGWSIADGPEWLNSVDMSFWSWNVAEPDTIASATGTSDYSKAFFKYTSDGSKDLIFAYNAEKRSFDETGNVAGGSGSSTSSNIMNVNFHHALAAVRFDVSGLKVKGFQIDSITINGAFSRGHCNVAGTAGTTDGGTVSFTWPADSLSEKNRYIQVLDSTDFTLPGLDTAKTANSLMSLYSDKFLFFIPQAVQNKGMKIKIVYSNASGSKTTVETDLDHATPWEAGKYYTYKLSIKKGLSVTVDDDLSDNVKDNLRIEYDGDKSAFIRASIVAYWVDAYGNFLSNCNYKTQGNLVGLNNDNKWVESSDDGFFYYNGEVESGTDVGPSLFTSYTAPVAPVDGAILRMVIAAQATEYDSSKTCYQAFNSNNTTK